MPEKEIKARGGATKIRTLNLGKNKKGQRVIAHVYVVRKAGPKGGHTVLGEKKVTKGGSSK